MSNVVDFHSHGGSDIEKIRDDAYFWLIKLDNSEITEAEIEQFKAWLAAKPEHKAELIRVGRLSKEFDTHFLTLILGEQDESQEVFVEPKASQGFWANLLLGKESFPRYAMGGGVVATVLMIALFLFDIGGKQEAMVYKNYATLVGEQKDVVLHDGSSIQINTDSELRVGYSSSYRTVHLVDGEAHFEVEHDPSRPFFVFANGLGVRAVGTAFSVYITENDQGPDKVEVVVSDGKVEISKLDIDSNKNVDEDLLKQSHYQDRVLANISKSERALIGQNSKLIETLDESRLFKRLAWQNKFLVFDDERLEDVMQVFDRYTETKIIMTDEKVKNMKIGGQFPIHGFELLLDTLEDSFDLAVERVSATEVHLSSMDIQDQR